VSVDYWGPLELLQTPNLWILVVQAIAVATNLGVADLFRMTPSLR
jgi:hypothetical protein